MSIWHLIASEFPPQPGGVSDYSAQIAAGLEAAGEEVRVWSREFGAFTPADLRRVGRLMDAYKAPRRVLLQWVPHGFGYRSMNVPFCFWLAGRRHDDLQIMVHEPGFGFGEGGPVHNTIALVHRAMAAILLRAADRVWISTEAWETRLRPLAFGRKLPICWLPVPSNIPVAPGYIPETYDLGYFGQYDPASIAQLQPILEAHNTLIIGRGSERVHHPRATVTGDLSPEDISYAIASCKVMLHLYPDGASGRRTTLMASLAHGKPVVTNKGPNTEPLLVPPAVEAAGLSPTIFQLLHNSQDRQIAAHHARQLYEAHFALNHTISALCASQ